MSDDDRVMTDAERVAAAEDHARDCERDADIAEGQARLAEATVARLREELAAARKANDGLCNEVIEAKLMLGKVLFQPNEKEAAERDLAAARRQLEEARELLERCAAGLGPCPLQREAFAFLAPPAATPPHSCPSCDLTDVSIPPGKLLATTPIKRPSPPRRDGHTVTCDAWNPGAPCNCGWAEIRAATPSPTCTCPGPAGTPHDVGCPGAPRNPEKPCATCAGIGQLDDGPDHPASPCPDCTPGAKP